MPSGCAVARCISVVLLTARVASAHQTSVKYVDLHVDGAHVAIELRVAPGDVTEPMGLPPDARPSVADAVGTAAVAPYVARWMQITARGAPCTASPPVARADQDGQLVVVAWAAECASSEDLALDLARFFAVDQRHIAIVKVDDRDSIVRSGDPPLALHASPSLLAWVRAGMDHIYDGRDHISFVLALLLVVMLVRRERWELRPLGATLRSTATVITAFTIAHSASLIAASLGWIHLPSRVVESIIALSIAYTAAENIARPDVRWRFWLTFGFGLVHGLGFASVLAELLPPHDVIVPLLCFNLGVELGQLTIVLVALPVFYLLAQRLGGERYRRVVMPALSAAIFALGAIWLIERVFGVS